jgi:ketosteroid isomerase-like protein
MISCRELGTGLVLRLRVPLLRSAIALLTVAAFGGVASAEGTSSAPRVEQRTATAIADAFNDAIARGDSAAARALLMPGVLIFESGDAERSADEYSRHHLLSDIEFMARMQIEQLSRNADGDQTTSWVATKSRMRGHYKGKAVDLDSTETLVLTRTSAGWRIAHIHWSSSPHRSGGPSTSSDEPG